MEDTEELTGLFTEALFDTAALEPALAKLSEVCSAPVAQLMLTDDDRTLLRSSFSGPVNWDTLENESLYQGVNPRVAAIPHMKVGHCTRDRDFIAYDDIKHDVAYQELVIPSGLGHFAGVPINLDPNSVVGLALHRPIDSDPFDNVDAQKFEIVAKGLMPVFSLASRIAKRDVQTAIGIVAPGTPAVILDHNMRVVDQNEAFDDLVKYEYLVQIKDKVLRARDVRTDARLREELGRKDVRVSKLVLRAAHGNRHRVAVLTKLPCLGISNNRVLITIEPEHVESSSLDKVKDAFALTEAETDVAAMLISGLSLTEISIRRDVQLSTVKTQLKGLFQKTQVKRQGELIALLLSLK